MSKLERIREAGAEDVETWLHLRRQLWPEIPEPQHRQQMQDHLDQPTRCTALLAARDDGWPVGCIELSLRGEVEGCAGSPVAYVEGWFVEAEWRQRGVAAALLRSAELWALLHGCREMASDCELAQVDGPGTARALGLEQLPGGARWRRDLPG
jgi:aminoglycoside 6'-N-acetyltransferase I